MVKVLILTTRHDCDDNRVYQKEVLSLADGGFQVFFVAPNNKERNHKNITYISIPKHNPYLKRRFLMKKVFRIVREIKPSIVHIQDIELLPVLFKIKKRLPFVKTIYDVHEDYRSQMLTKLSIPVMFRKIASIYVSKLENKSNKAVDYIVCADPLTSDYFDKTKTSVIYNYPKISDYKVDKMNKDIRLRSQYDLIFPGSMRIFTYKTIVDIVSICHTRGVNLSCCIISPFRIPGGKEEVISYIKSKGLPLSLFSLINPVPPTSVQDYLSKSKIGILPLPDTPKLQKNIPTKLFEYMIEYLPIVGSDLKPSRQFVTDGETGFLVKYDSIADYADKIIYILNNPDEANRMGECGHNLVIKNYSWENEANKLLNIYRNLIDYE